MTSINHIEQLRARLESGAVAIGTAVTFADAAISELSAEAGYDFVWIDTEHAPFDLNTVLQHVVACRGTGAAPFVRVLKNDADIIKPVLDLAPAGIVVPRVNSAAEARAAVAACRYPPGGIRGFGPRRGARFGATSQPAYLAEVASEPILAVQVEHIEAVENIDEILAVEGVDIICIGPNDLSGSLGKLGQIDDPDVVAAIEGVADKVSRTRHILGTSTFYSPETFARWMDLGVRWINLNVDFANLYRASHEVLQAARDNSEST